MTENQTFSANIYAIQEMYLQIFFFVRRWCCCCCRYCIVSSFSLPEGFVVVEECTPVRLFEWLGISVCHITTGDIHLLCLLEWCSCVICLNNKYELWNFVGFSILSVPIPSKLGRWQEYRVVEHEPEEILDDFWLAQRLYRIRVKIEK